MGDIMKKNIKLIFIGIILLMILTFALQCFFKEQTKSFEISCGAAFLSIFCLFEYKNSLTPSKKGFGSPINMTKKYYEEKQELYKYKNLCRNLFIVAISIAALSLISGVIDIFLTYLISVLQS